MHEIELEDHCSQLGGKGEKSRLLKHDVFLLACALQCSRWSYSVLYLRLFNFRSVYLSNRHTDWVAYAEPNVPAMQMLLSEQFRGSFQLYPATFVALHNIFVCRTSCEPGENHAGLAVLIEEVCCRLVFRVSTKCYSTSTVNSENSTFATF